MRRRRYYSFHEALKIYKRIEPPDLGVDDLILLVLGVLDKPVQCRYVLMNEIFIFYDELKSKLKIIDPEFEPSRYGAYSFNVFFLLLLMEDHGNIVRTHPRNVFLERYSLTDSGKALASDVLKKIENKLGSQYLEHLRVMRIGLDELGYYGIKNYIKQYYPEWLKC